MLLAGCNARTPRNFQLAELDRHAPGELTPVRTQPRQPTLTVRVKVLIDDDYEAQVLHPEDAARERFTRASAYTEGALDTRFEVVAVEHWSHRQGTTPLQTTVRELAAQYASDPADLVVGFVSSLPLLEFQQETVGTAPMLGHVMLLRAFRERYELGELRKWATALSDEEVLEFYRKHRLHMETASLLHELGHLLGAPHDLLPHSIMQGHYDRSSDGYSALALKVMRATLSARRDHLPLRAQAHAIRAQLDAAREGELDGHDLPEYLALLEQLEAERTVSQPVSADDQRQYERAWQLFHASMYEESKAVLAPLVARLPNVSAIRALDCAVQRALGPKEALPACEAAAKATPGSSVPLLQLAQTQLAAKNPAAAAESLRTALTLLDGAADGAADDAEAGWPMAMAVARTLQCISWTERAASHAGKSAEVDQALDWAKKMRRWGSLPGTVDACEGPQLEQFRLALEAIEHDPRAAEKRIAAYPSGAAHDALSCELSVRRGSLKEARAACEHAIALDAESTHAHYLLGVIAEREHRRDEEVKELSTVLELGPENEDAWSRLAHAYAQGHATDELKKLQARYQERFGRPLR
ncbi:MAG: hypothetical protein QM723_35295 [Myxococcaceae bacterium]